MQTWLQGRESHLKALMKPELLPNPSTVYNCTTRKSVLQLKQHSGDENIPSKNIRKDRIKRCFIRAQMLGFKPCS